MLPPISRSKTSALNIGPPIVELARLCPDEGHYRNIPIPIPLFLWGVAVGWLHGAPALCSAFEANAGLPALSGALMCPTIHERERPRRYLRRPSLAINALYRAGSV